MTNFENTYLMHRPPKIAISYADGSDKKSGVYVISFNGRSLKVKI